MEISEVKKVLEAALMCTQEPLALSELRRMAKVADKAAEWFAGPGNPPALEPVPQAIKDADAAGLALAAFKQGFAEGMCFVQDGGTDMETGAANAWISMTSDV